LENIYSEFKKEMSFFATARTATVVSRIVVITTGAIYREQNM
jgi:hypothetical protein